MSSPSSSSFPRERVCFSRGVELFWTLSLGVDNENPERKVLFLIGEIRTSFFDKGPASQGTPPNSPAAAVSAFSRVVGAVRETNKQNQVQGANPLGLAAVLLQGAQGKSGGESRAEREAR